MTGSEITGGLEAVDRDGAVREAAVEVSETLEASGDTRLDFFKKAGLAGGAVIGGGALMSALVPGAALAKGSGRPPKSFGKGDIGILNYALTLEYLEAAFYEEATANNAGSSFVSSTPTAVFLETVTRDEREHVKALKSVLGGKAVKKPEFDFGQATSDEAQFIATAVALENTGVGAYSGQALNIKDPEVIGAALSILTVEARHASVIGLIQSETSGGHRPRRPVRQGAVGEEGPEGGRGDRLHHGLTVRDAAPWGSCGAAVATFPAASLAFSAAPGEVAQLVEHTTENRGVASSILALAMKLPIETGRLRLRS